jgi:hypothetical protein
MRRGSGRVNAGAGAVSCLEQHTSDQMVILLVYRQIMHAGGHMGAIVLQGYSRIDEDLFPRLPMMFLAITGRVARKRPRKPHLIGQFRLVRSRSIQRVLDMLKSGRSCDARY